MDEFFPLRIITGKYFCNRVREREILKNNLNRKRHTILVSPRRYGKTSLASQVFSEMDNNWVFGNTDFLVALDAKDVEHMILNLVGMVLPKLLPNHKNIFEKIKSFFSFTQAKLVISETGPSIEFSKGQKPQQTIIDALIGLDRIAGNQKKQVGLLLDEFQQVGQINDAEPIEAAIRHAAERAKHVCIIFSGSNRHLLSQMFDDSSRPLYHLSEKLPLERILPDEYKKHFNLLAKQRWQKTLSPQVIDQILYRSECHPYFVNLLCARLWDKKVPPLTENEVQKTWFGYVDEEKGRIADELSQLTLNQKKVFFGMAHERILQPTHSAFLQKIGLSSASVLQAAKSLLDKDFIYKDHEDAYCILDPSVKTFITAQSN